MNQPLIKEVLLSEIKPYWRNPRNNITAVRKVADSIKRYGYNQFITVDKDMVIITGHTRHKALKQLGTPKVNVIVLDLDEQKAKEYRIVDNKSSELAEWTDDLIPELREIEDINFVDEFFTEDINFLIDKSTGSSSFKEITEDKILNKADKMSGYGKDGEAYQKSVFEVICPECGNEFDVR